MMLSKLIGQSGEVEFSAVVNESVEMQNRVTTFTVEEGQDVADHISLDPDGIPISGVVTGEDAAQKLDRLRDFRNKREVLTFIGRNVFSGAVIGNLMTRHNAKTSDGFEFDITLRKVRIAQTREVQITAVQNKGLQQPQKKEPFFTFQERGSSS